MKRHRGQRRYYRNLIIQNDISKVIWLNFNDTNTWFDKWHLHFDKRGYGNNSFKRRKPHLDKLFRHFDLLVNQTKKLKTDFQLFVVIFDFSSYNDALYLHTPNPNSSPFPVETGAISSTTTLTNEALNNYIDKLNKYEVLYIQVEEPYCLLYQKEVGHSL